MKVKLLILLILLLSFCTLFSDVVNYDKVIRNLKGIKSYEKEEFENSEDNFKRNAIKYPKDSRLHFNQANAQVKNGMLEEAEQNYKLALNNENFDDRSKALQNLGNVKFLQKDYKNAIKNYRDALVENPQNLDARYNYELAARMLQRQQEQKQQQQQNRLHYKQYIFDIFGTVVDLVCLDDHCLIIRFIQFHDIHTTDILFGFKPEKPVFMHSKDEPKAVPSSARS